MPSEEEEKKIANVNDKNYMAIKSKVSSNQRTLA
jgi:hypothetical protein